MLLYKSAQVNDSILFSFELISPALQKSLPKDFTLRPLEKTDFAKGFSATLGQLSITDGLTKDKFNEIFHEMKLSKNTFVVVIEDTARNHIAAAGTLLVERKFLRGGGLVGHIEDIVVDKAYRGKDFGKIIIEQLKFVATCTKCYKTILDCAEHNVKFYEKCGFKLKEVQMVIYAEPASKL